MTAISTNVALPDAPRPALVGVAGVVLEAFAEGVLWWADRRMAVVADLHLEKGSSYARRGQMLPPYDTAETLARLGRAVARLDPATVVCLGDSFHDDGGALRLRAEDRATLRALQHGRDFIWIAGNHDPGRPHGLDGEHRGDARSGPLTFRHAPWRAAGRARSPGISTPARGSPDAASRCGGNASPATGTRLVLPAFGAYAGGLNVLDRPSPGCSPRRASGPSCWARRRSMRSAGGRCGGIEPADRSFFSPSPLTAAAPRSISPSHRSGPLWRQGRLP